MLQTLYKKLFQLARPFIKTLLNKRIARGKEDPKRQNERYGQPKKMRPSGKLIWCHGASVGESLSLIALIKRLLADFPDIHIMVTTGTVTSARLMAERLPEQAFHQYIPVDHPVWGARFIDHWKPDMVLWAESDFWPNMLQEIKKRDIPLALVNARISPRSYKKWQLLSGWIKNILANFTICLAQNKQEAQKFIDLGAQRVEDTGNLKYAAQALPCDISEQEEMENIISERVAWLMASSHPGEEEQVAEVHLALKKQKIPAILSVIVPRHPERGAEIKTQLENLGLTIAQRSLGEKITSDVDIYIADTLGELGLFFRTVPLVCIGGSFVPHGGHNPIEPAQLGCQILYGPHMFNFETICADFEGVSACRPVDTLKELEEELLYFMHNQVEGKKMSEEARKLVEAKSGVVDNIIKILQPIFKKSGLL